MDPSSPWAAPPPVRGPAPAASTRAEQAVALALAVLLVLAMQVLLDARRATPAPAAAPVAATRSPAPPPPAAEAPIRPPAPARAQPQPPRPPAPPVVPAAPAPVLVPVTGRVLDADGRPAPGVVVLARRHVGGLEAFFTGLTAVFTLGLACLAGVCDSDEVRAVTGPDGRFRLRLPEGTDVGRPGDHDLVAAVPGPQPEVPLRTTSIRWDHTGAAQDLGDVRLWRPRLAVSRGGGQVRADFARLDEAYGGDARYALTYTDAAGAPAYRLSDVQPGQSVDGRLVERGVVRAQVSGTTKDRRSKRREHAAAPVTVPDGPLPLSRGRGCSRYGSSGRLVPVPGCPFTDGRLGAEVGPAGTPAGTCPETTAGCRETSGAVVVDLAAARPVSLVVLRGCTFDCSVQTSTDGRTWGERTTTEFGHDEDVALALPPRTARYVRVLYSFSIDLTTAREVSVF